jgi:hypothetical protein
MIGIVSVGEGAERVTGNRMASLEGRAVIKRLTSTNTDQWIGE